MRCALLWAANNAPSPDEVRYEDAVKRSAGEVEQLADLWNSNIENAAINEEWEHGYVATLTKPGKDRMKIQEYEVIIS